jgi:hypothetical protein
MHRPNALLRLFLHTTFKAIHTFLPLLKLFTLRRYIHRITSIYKDDSIEDTSSIATKAMQKEVIGSIEVYAQDVDFE